MLEGCALSQAFAKILGKRVSFRSTLSWGAGHPLSTLAGVPPFKWKKISSAPQCPSLTTHIWHVGSVGRTEAPCLSQDLAFLSRAIGYPWHFQPVDHHKSDYGGRAGDRKGNLPTKINQRRFATMGRDGSSLTASPCLWSSIPPFGGCRCHHRGLWHLFGEYSECSHVSVVCLLCCDFPLLSR